MNSTTTDNVNNMRAHYAKLLAEHPDTALDPPINAAARACGLLVPNLHLPAAHSPEPGFVKPARFIGGMPMPSAWSYSRFYLWDRGPQVRKGPSGKKSGAPRFRFS